MCRLGARGLRLIEVTRDRNMAGDLVLRCRGFGTCSSVTMLRSEMPSGIDNLGYLPRKSGIPESIIDADCEHD